MIQLFFENASYLGSGSPWKHVLHTIILLTYFLLIYLLNYLNLLSLDTHLAGGAEVARHATEYSPLEPPSTVLVLHFGLIKSRTSLYADFFLLIFA